MQFEPAVKDAAGRVEPAAKDFTGKTVRPAGDYVADNAVPMTKEYGELLAGRPSSKSFSCALHFALWTSTFSVAQP